MYSYCTSCSYIHTNNRVVCIHILSTSTILGLRVYWFHSRLHCVHCALCTPIRERMLLALYSYCILNTISLCVSVVPVPVGMILLSRTYWSTCTTPGELCHFSLAIIQRAQTSVRGSLLYDTPVHQYVLIPVVCRYAWYGYYYPVHAIDIAYRAVKSGWNGATGTYVDDKYSRGQSTYLDLRIYSLFVCRSRNEHCM